MVLSTPHTLYILTVSGHYLERLDTPRRIMKSKFKIGIFCLVIPSMIGLMFLTVTLWISMLIHPDRIIGVIIMIITFLTLTSIILLREAKFKWNRIQLTDTELILTSFLGLGVDRRIRLNEVTGFNRAFEHSKTSDGQAIYIYVNGHRAVEFSDAYYRNFKQIYEGLRNRVKELGDEDFSFSKHFLNAFGKRIELPQK